MASPLNTFMEIEIPRITFDGIALGEQTTLAPLALKSFFVFLTTKAQTESFPHTPFSTPALSERGSSLRIYIEM